MDKGLLTPSTPDARSRKPQRRFLPGIALIGLLLVVGRIHWAFTGPHRASSRLPLYASASLARCASLNEAAGPPEDFHTRSESDRFVPGVPPTLLRNAKIWTGGENGTEIVHGSVLIDKGLIKAIGRVHQSLLDPYKDLVIIDVHDAWVTPGIVDVHSHIGDASSPFLSGASDDDNSVKGPTQPWLRSLDGLNTHDDSYALSIAGGVTTALVLPGSANAIGGQGFTIKLRLTAEQTPTSLLVEPPYQINGSKPTGPPRWRQLKQACGENPSRVYGFTRMDTIWSFRAAYNKAREIKEAQDAYCLRAEAHEWDGLGEFPEDLQWEAAVDVLRGRVKVHTHCYEAVDLDALVRLSQEFQFPIAAVHHASEAYLVPDLLKSAHGHPPAVALFATNSRYKREAYRASEFAPRILAEHGLQVMMKSDHPVMPERDLLFEAQQAHFYGLPPNLALAAVTTTPAQVLGLDHRVGVIRVGWDADLVVWDSHPLALGATPKQVYIDGIRQMPRPKVVTKSAAFQEVPHVPDFGDEAQEAVRYEGLPPLKPTSVKEGTVHFLNVASVYVPEEGGAGVEEVFMAASGKDGERQLGDVVVRDGKIACVGVMGQCIAALNGDEGVKTVNLSGGSIQPGLATFGAPLGVQEIDQEPSTGDGYVADPLEGDIPTILGGTLVRAVDGLSFQGRDALYAYRAGVTTAVTAPSQRGFFGGLSTAFALGAEHKLAPGAIIADVAAVHVTIGPSWTRAPSVSTQIAALRHLLLGGGKGDVAQRFKEVAEGKLTLVVKAQSADVIASLVLLKKEVERETNADVKLTIVGAAESHLLAEELAEANIGVLLVPFRSFPYEWQSRRILPGPPITQKSAVGVLLAHNVTLGLGVLEAWDARNTRFYMAWAAIEAGGELSKKQTFALGSTNVELLLGSRAEVASAALGPDLVATEGGDLLSFEGKPVAVISPRRGTVEVW